MVCEQATDITLTIKQRAFIIKSDRFTGNRDTNGIKKRTHIISYRISLTRNVILVLKYLFKKGLHVRQHVAHILESKQTY